MFLDTLIGIARESLFLFNKMSPFLLMGFFFAGVLHVAFPLDAFARHLGRSDLRSVIKAVVLGIPLPLCSCGVIPSAVLLRKKGASRGAVLSFLVATPITGVDSILATYSLLGLAFTVFRVVAASLTALCTGIVANLLLPREEGSMHVHSYPPAQSDPECCHEDAVKRNMTVRERAVELFRYAFVEILGDVWKWVLIGVVIGGMISYLIPEELIQRYLGGGLQAMIVMLVIGIPMYVCATGSIPIAAALIFKGMSPGAAIVFLLAGPATNAVTITIVSKILGKNATIIYVACIALMSIAMGYLLDYIGRFELVISGDAMMEMLPAWVEYASSVVLCALFIIAIVRSVRHGAGKADCCEHEEKH